MRLDNSQLLLGAQALAWAVVPRPWIHFLRTSWHETLWPWPPLQVQSQSCWGHAGSWAM